MYEGSVFFKPNKEFLNWLIAYLDNRHFIDMGCGEGHLTEALFKKGGRGMGVDLYDSMNWGLIRIKHAGKLNIHLFEADVTDPNNITNKMMHSPHAKPVAIFARPCHGTFVEKAIDLMPSGAEILYITLPENIHKYNDLGDYKEYAELIPHEGSSADNEVVYRVIKP